MEVLEKFFNGLQLPKEVVPNGSTIWENPLADSPMNHIIHRKYYSLGDIQIHQLETELNKINFMINIKFPEWYKRFLHYVNGIDLFFGVIALYGFQIINRADPKHETPYSLYTENLGRHKKVPKEWLFIGSYGYDGTEIVTDTSASGSKIFCIYSEQDKVICTWDSFEQFLSSELKRIGDLYKQKPWGRIGKGANTLPIGHKDNPTGKGR